MSNGFWYVLTLLTSFRLETYTIRLDLEAYLFCLIVVVGNVDGDGHQFLMAMIISFIFQILIIV